MKLSELSRLSSFALFGPGFGRSEFTLVAPLEPTRGSGSVAFVPYAKNAASGGWFDGDTRRDRLEIDIAPAVLTPELQAGGHASAVQMIREAIAAGDVYQVNLTVRAHLPSVSGGSLFAAFCRRSVPPFAAWLRLPSGEELVSASPELFFEIRGAKIRSQPMKGTAAVDGAGQLAASEKDTAELAMITDLIRNDLTLVCSPHSVRVEKERAFIELPYAIQTVSEVAGTLLPDVMLSDVIDALHPGGSITGAPKHAAMRMIERLEPAPRGAYCGTLGLIDGDHSVFSLLIRTAERTPDGWMYGVGGGIVWDSDASREWEEIQIKLGALR